MSRTDPLTDLPFIATHDGFGSFPRQPGDAGLFAALMASPAVSLVPVPPRARTGLPCTLHGAEIYYFATREGGKDILLFADLSMEDSDTFGAYATELRMTWRSDVPNSLASGLFMDVIRPRFESVISDGCQNAYGGEFWIAMMQEAHDAGLTVGSVVDNVFRRCTADVTAWAGEIDLWRRDARDDDYAISYRRAVISSRSVADGTFTKTRAGRHHSV